MAISTAPYTAHMRNVATPFSIRTMTKPTSTPNINPNMTISPSSIGTYVGLTRVSLSTTRAIPNAVIIPNMGMKPIKKTVGFSIVRPANAMTTPRRRNKEITPSWWSIAYEPIVSKTESTLPKTLSTTLIPWTKRRRSSVQILIIYRPWKYFKIRNSCSCR